MVQEYQQVEDISRKSDARNPHERKIAKFLSRKDDENEEDEDED